MRRHAFRAVELSGGCTQLKKGDGLSGAYARRPKTGVHEGVSASSGLSVERPGMGLLGPRFAPCPYASKLSERKGRGVRKRTTFSTYAQS